MYAPSYYVATDTYQIHNIIDFYRLYLRVQHAKRNNNTTK